LAEIGEKNVDGWLASSPLAVATERERAVLAGLGATSTEPGTCFRALFALAGADSDG